jgi:CO dehydrogenase maturation factor
LKSIAITGKGGTGKTAVAALLIKYLTETNHRAVLAIDADPDTNLPDVLGDTVEHTIGEMREFLLEERDRLPPDINKESLLEGKIYSVLIEKPRYDLLVMGRPEGSGCYCYANNLLRSIMDRIIKNYDVVVIDTAAGLEHISRGIIRDITDLLVVTDGSRRGLETAERIRDLIEELKLDIKNLWTAANKVTDENRKRLQEYAEKLNLELVAMIPLDENIARFDLEGKPLVELPEDSPAVIEITRMVKKIEL